MQKEGGKVEEWKPIPSFAAYEASSFGRLKRRISGKGTEIGKILKPSIRKDGYLQVSLHRKNKLIHYLICETFNGKKPTAKHQCNHKDGDRKNNIPENLEWVTSSENNYHRHRILKCRNNSKTWIVTSPDGIEQTIVSLHKFCKENGLLNPCMFGVLKGRATHHRGWKVRRSEIKK